jgi:hypothetical protein
MPITMELLGIPSYYGRTRHPNTWALGIALPFVIVDITTSSSPDPGLTWFSATGKYFGK